MLEPSCLEVVGGEWREDEAEAEAEEGDGRADRGTNALNLEEWFAPPGKDEALEGTRLLEYPPELARKEFLLLWWPRPSADFAAVRCLLNLSEVGSEAEAAGFAVT